MTRVYQIVDDEGATVESGGWLGVIAYDQHGQQVGEPQLARAVMTAPQEVQVNVHISDDIGDLIATEVEAVIKDERRLGRMR